MRTGVITSVVLLVLTALSGCAAREVRCDGPLERINPPETAVAPAAAGQPSGAQQAPAP